MPLTDEQRERRRHGIGASEIPAIAGLSPFRSPLDVYLEKLGVVEDDENGNDQTQVGTILEPAVRQLYAERTGQVVKPCETMVHEQYKWAFATPDGETENNKLVEIKVVGRRMMHQWQDGPPDYVTAQALWQLMVRNRQVADIAALLGTELIISPVERDDALISDLFEIGKAFWHDNVLAKVPPAPTDTEDRYEYMRRRFAEYTHDMVDVTADTAVAELVQALVTAQDRYKDAEAAKKEIQAALMERIGTHAGIFGAWGKITWKAPATGPVGWKAIAHELAHGEVPQSLIAKHTGAASRRFETRGIKKG